MAKSWPAFEFFFLVAIAVIAGWSALATTLTLAWNGDQYTYILLIIPVSAALIWLDRSNLASGRGHDLRAAPMLLLFAGAMALAGRWLPGIQSDETLSLSMLALVTWWIGAFVFCFGAKVAKAFLFPLAFLLWLTPFPNVLLREIVSLLQQGSAFAAHQLFEVVGVPVVRDGIRLSIPGLTIEVATECSSIRSSMMLLVTTMVLAQLTLRSPWRKLLAFAIAMPLSVAKNGLRIFVIAMLGTRVDPAYLTGKLHHQGGGIYFGLALLVMFLVLWVLHRAENGRKSGLAPGSSTAARTGHG